MKSVAIIQARAGSTRLPGKVLRELCGRTVLAQVIRRVARCPLLDAVVVATTTGRADDAVEREARAQGAQVFRGSEDDVLARYHGAALEAGADNIVRVTADCPLFDPEVLGRMLEAFFARRAKLGATALLYLSNTLGRRTFPRGLDAEIFTMAALSAAHAAAREPWDREHVTPYFYGHPERFVLESFQQAADCSAHRWTLDTEEDWALIHAIHAALGADGRDFTTREVLAYLAAHPELVALNAHVEQKRPASQGGR
jgi:spore coat polysaccharide biosynthesis protein SpsF